MTDLADISEVEQALGADFFEQPRSALREPFSVIYASALNEFRKTVRNRDGNVFDYILAERLAFSYAILRQREADTGEEEDRLTDRTRRELNKDMIEFTISLKKIWNSEDRTDQSEALLKKVDKAVVDAMKSIPKDQAEILQSVLAKEFVKVGI